METTTPLNATTSRGVTFDFSIDNCCGEANIEMATIALNNKSFSPV
jgi:hypothetical protein